jgi:hypothetical protein
VFSGLFFPLFLFSFLFLKESTKVGYADAPTPRTPKDPFTIAKVSLGNSFANNFITVRFLDQEYLHAELHLSHWCRHDF